MKRRGRQATACAVQLLQSPVLNERLWSEGTEVKFIGVADPFVRSIEYDVGGLSIISQED